MDLKEVCQRFVGACDRISGSWSLEEGMSGLAHLVMSLLKSRSVAVILAGHDDGALKIVGSRGLSGTFVSHCHIHADEPAVQRVTTGGQDVAMDVRVDDPQCGSLRLENQKGSLIATPVNAMSRTIGLLVATSDETGHFTEEHMLLLKLAARLAAACHDRHSLYEERRHFMAIDPETGLWSFEFFCNRMHEEIARSRRQSTPLSLALVDIDGFMQYRQTHGTPAADKLFIHFVEVIRSAVRGIDFLGHFGLDEVLVALPQTDLRGAVKAAERIREAIAQADLPKSPKPISASIGVAALHDQEDRPGDMLERAKRGLYETYVRGGNCVCAESA